jgi:hypothetical protein
MERVEAREAKRKKRKRKSLMSWIDSQSHSHLVP